MSIKETGTFSVIAKFLHHIDVAANQVKEIPFEESRNSGLDEYILELISNIQDSNSDSVHSYVIPQDRISYLGGYFNGSIVDGSFDEFAKDLAKRLLAVELDTNKKIAHLNRQVTKGSLLQIIGQYGERAMIVIAKVDHDQFLDEIQLVKRIGLPYEKRTLKSCVIEFFEEEIISVSLLDSSRRISKFWWSDLLDLEETRSESVNTKQAFAVIKSNLDRRVKPVSKEDHIELRNGAIAYFRQNETYQHSDFMEKVISPYIPMNEDLDWERVSRTFEDLPEKKKFDRSFEIVHSEIKARFTNRISLTPELDLTLKQDVPKLRSTIVALKEGNRKFIKIETANGYDYFKKENVQRNNT